MSVIFGFFKNLCNGCTPSNYDQDLEEPLKEKTEEVGHFFFLKQGFNEALSKKNISDEEKLEYLLTSLGLKINTPIHTDMFLNARAELAEYLAEKCTFDELEKLKKEFENMEQICFFEAIFDLAKVYKTAKKLSDPHFNVREEDLALPLINASTDYIYYVFILNKIIAPLEEITPFDIDKALECVDKISNTMRNVTIQYIAEKTQAFDILTNHNLTIAKKLADAYKVGSIVEENEKKRMLEKIESASNKAIH